MSEMIQTVNSVGRVFCEHAGGMFLQTGVLIAVLLCADFFLRRRVRATLRYWIWMLVFVKLLLPPSLSVPTGIGYWLGGRTPAAVAPGTIGNIRTPVTVEASAPVEIPPVQVSHSGPAMIQPIESMTTHSEPLTWQGGVFVLWIAGVLVFAGLVIQRWRFVKGLIARSEPVSDDLTDLLDQCRRRMGVRRRVGLRLSPNAFSPAVCGLLSPTILVPRAILDRLSSEGLRAVLIHELAHVRRGDLWANSLQTALQVVYFYNPLAWLANVIVRRVREQAVDEMALVALGAEARSYGNTLIDIAEMAFLRVSPALRLIGVAESRKSLEGRIRHMMTRPMPKSARVGVIGMLAVAAIGAILLPMARAQNRAAQSLDTGLADGEFKILLLDDRDPESREKAVYDDRLYLMDSKGRIEGAVTGFNVNELFGGSHVLAVDERRKTLWVAENAGSQLWHFDLADGKLLQQVSLPHIHAVAVDQTTGNVWVVIDEGRLDVLSPVGKLVATYPVGGYDIAHSNRDDSFWVVGKRVTRIGKDGKVLFQMADEVSWLAVCVSVDQTTGAAWVVVRDNPNVPESTPELLAVDENGRLQQRIDLGDLIPFSVAVDSDNGIVWVGCLGTTLRYTTQGEKLKSARFASGFSVAPGASGDSVIAASDSDLVMATVADTGRVDVGFPPIEVRRDLLSSSQKWVAKVPWGGAKLQSSPELAGLTMDRDAHLKLADYPESAERLGALGKALLMYANDYEDKLPDALENLRAYVDERNRRSYVEEADVKWFQDNVEYLGKGRNMADRPDIVVAYDKSVLRRGEGTLVLYLDSRVAFEGPHKLETLGIAMPPVATRPDDQGKAARAKSAELLMNLIRVTLIWSNEHDDKLPDSVEDLPEDAFTSADKEWLSKNVAYLGKGLSLWDTPAGRVIAYDKTLLAEGNGTNVLYMDTHVAFEQPEVLKRLGITAAAADSNSRQVFRSYEVNRSVADFAPGEDFSTPEAAYATINRMDREDSSAWKRVSVARMADRFRPDGSERKRPVDPEWAKVLANARIREVLIWNMTKVAVIAELPQELSSKKIVDPLDVRFLQLENGRWLNIGNGRFASIDAAKTHFMGWMERETSQADVMRDPLQHADEVKQAARRIFENIRSADYAEILSYHRNGRNGKWAQDGWKKFPTWGHYMVHTDYPSFALWCSTHFQDNPIVDIQLGDVFIGDTLVLNKTGWPTVPYRLTLKDGTVLSGNLPFRYVVNKDKGYWEGMEGIDWHLWPNGTK